MIKRNFKRTSGLLLLVMGLFAILLQKGLGQGSSAQNDLLNVLTPDVARADFTAASCTASDSDNGMEGGGPGDGGCGCGASDSGGDAGGCL